MTKEIAFAWTRSLGEQLFIPQVIAIFGFLLLSLPAYCQVYTYSDAYESGDSVAGYSSVTGYYNSSTHVYTSNITVYSPTGRTSSASTSGTSVSTSISLNFEDGVFTLSSSFVGTCPNPYGGGNHQVGGGGAQTPVAPFIEITSLSFSVNPIGNEATNVTAQLSKSSSIQGNITIDLTEDSHSTPTPNFTINGGPKTINIQPSDQVTEYTWVNGVSGSSTQPAGSKWVKVKAQITSYPTTSPATVVRPPNPRVSENLVLN